MRSPLNSHIAPRLPAARLCSRSKIEAGWWVSRPPAGTLVEKALEAGVNLFDAAGVYAVGDSERFLGEVLRNLGVLRESYCVASC